MSRDMKPRKQAAQPKRKGGIFLGIFIGLLLGALVAAGFAWYIAKMPMPFQNRSAAAPEPKPEPKAAVQAAQPIALPGKPGDKVDDKPRFEFYKILPGKEATDEAVAAKPAEGAKPADNAKPGEAAKVMEVSKAAAEPLYLQAGAFTNPAEADNLKARLALMGVESSVQPVTLPEKGTILRVRVGPFTKPDDAAGVRSQLTQAGIATTLVKGKD